MQHIPVDPDIEELNDRLDSLTKTISHETKVLEMLSNYHTIKKDIQRGLEDKQRSLDSIIQDYRNELAMVRKQSASSSSVTTKHELERVKSTIEVEESHFQEFKNHHAKELQEVQALEHSISRFSSEVDPTSTELSGKIRLTLEELRTCEMQIAVYQTLSNIQFLETPEGDSHDLQGVIKLTAMGELRPFKVDSAIALASAQQMFWDMLYDEYNESINPSIR